MKAVSAVTQVTKGLRQSQPVRRKVRPLRRSGLLHFWRYALLLDLCPEPGILMRSPEDRFEDGDGEGWVVVDGERDLNRALDTLQTEVPDLLCRAIRWLRDPKVRWVRERAGTSGAMQYRNR